MILERIAGLKRFASDEEYRRLVLERKRIGRTARYVPGSTNILGPELKFVDSVSFLYMFDEIFTREIYRFSTGVESPRIIDCGANIGLSAIYFKRLFPKARVTAFEPDPKVCRVLVENLASFGFADVECVEKGVWREDGRLDFHSEGADAGRIARAGDALAGSIETVRLRPYLSGKVDFLKVDIEGAETEVIEDCAVELKKVENLFVEYHSFADSPQTLHRILSIMSAAGFRVQIHPPFVSPQPFFEREKRLGMDMQLNIFGYRE